MNRYLYRATHLSEWLAGRRYERSMRWTPEQVADIRQHIAEIGPTHYAHRRPDGTFRIERAGLNGEAGE